MLVIGSTALARVLDIGRVSADIDFICTTDEMIDYVKAYSLQIKPLAQYKAAGLDKAGNIRAEFELLHESESGRKYVEYTAAHPSYLWVASGCPLPMYYAPIEVLYSIKKSHRHYPRAWKKHIQDLMLMNDTVAGWDVLSEITKIRERETEIREGRLKTPSLATSKEKFFNDNVSNQLFIHDQIHEVMAHRDRPMFEYVKKYPDDPDSVACSKEKFFELPVGARIQCVLEESYVIALERCILPMVYQGRSPVTSDEAWDYAIMRICTTLCSGWFREFATMNYSSIKAMRNHQYAEKFFRAVQDGKIKRIEEVSVDAAGRECLRAAIPQIWAEDQIEG